MGRRFIDNGSQMTFTAAADLSADDVVVINSLVVGVVPNDVASGAVGIADVAGKFELPKSSGEALSAGARVYWNSTSGITGTATANTYAGIVARSAASADLSVDVTLTSAIGPSGISGFSGAAG